MTRFSYANSSKPRSTYIKISNALMIPRLRELISNLNPTCQLNLNSV